MIAILLNSRAELTPVFAQMALISMCMMAAPQNVQASTVSSEGVSRQIQALRSAMSSFKSVTDANVSALQERENKRTACFNVNQIYWPTHPKASSDGCVSHEHVSTSSGAYCPQSTINWAKTGNHLITVPGQAGCSVTAHPTPEGAEITLKQFVDPSAKRHCAEIPYYDGEITVRCVNGEYEVLSSYCVGAQRTCR